jgi:hypothetical protein
MQIFNIDGNLDAVSIRNDHCLKETQKELQILKKGSCYRKRGMRKLHAYHYDFEQTISDNSVINYVFYALIFLVFIFLIIGEDK